MDIELIVLNEKLQLLEKVENNPELILTDLFSKTDSLGLIIGRLSINGEHLPDYLQRNLQKIEALSGCRVNFHTNYMNLYAPSLCFNKERADRLNDNILSVDFAKRTYELHNDFEEFYRIRTEKNPELETYELSDFWKEFENFTPKRRVKKAFRSFLSDKPMHIRLFDFVYCLFVKREKIDERVRKEKEKIEERKNDALKWYTYSVAEYAFYKTHADEHIKMLCDKQEKIVEYLISLGFVEDMKECK